jgi:hypothetical protein
VVRQTASREQPINGKVITLDAKKRNAFKAPGWRFGDASDFSLISR